MFDTDDEIILQALDMWRNYIETFNVSMSAEYARAKRYEPKEHYEPNHLTRAQKELIEDIKRITDSIKEKENTNVSD